VTDGPLLADLHFGREDAERDVTEGLLLRGGFLPNAAYRGALSGRKMLIIGRKGSGKSAICMQLMADGEGGHRGGKVLVTPDEAAGEEIRRFELQGLPGDSAKALIWRYVFAVHAARYVVDHAKGAHDGGHKTDTVKALARFLKQNGEAAPQAGCEPMWKRPTASRSGWIRPGGWSTASSTATRRSSRTTTSRRDRPRDRRAGP